jgi:hypothetical protein
LWLALLGFSFPLLFLLLLLGEVSLALCKRVVWFCQLASLSIEVKDHNTLQCNFSERVCENKQEELN